MSRYLITKIPFQEDPPPDELHVRFTIDLPDLNDCHHAINFALDHIQAAPAPPPTAITSLLKLIRNFLPPPRPR